MNRVGVFATLTNAYSLVAIGASENFYRYVSYNQSISGEWGLGNIEDSGVR